MALASKLSPARPILKRKYAEPHRDEEGKRICITRQDLSSSDDEDDSDYEPLEGEDNPLDHTFDSDEDGDKDTDDDKEEGEDVDEEEEDGDDQ